MTDQASVPIPKNEAEVKLSIGADEVARQVSLVLEITGHPSGPLRVKVNYDEGEALKLAEKLLLAAGRIQRLGADRPGVVIPQKRHGAIAPVLKLPKR